MLSGLVMVLLGCVAKPGDKIGWEDWQLEAVDMENMRIVKVLATPMATDLPIPTTNPVTLIDDEKTSLIVP